MTLAIDIGGTKIAAATVIDGVCHDRRQLPMPASEPEFLATLAALAQGRPAPALAAVAVTGYTDGERVRGVNRNTIAFWNDYPLVPRLRALLRCPVLALNDAQAAAWGEYGLRQAECSNLLYLTLSTGVGGGLVLDGELRRGAQGLAGHLGHMAVDVAPTDGPMVCGCGRRGCLETVASGTALARQATGRFGRVLGSAELFDRVAQGVPEAQDILWRAARAVASAVASAHAQLDLQQVVLGGSVGLAAGMRALVEAALAELPPLYRLPVDVARLGADAGLVGVAAWAVRQPLQGQA
ncbi:ROK family protein [Acidovorax soli]|uniref:N-acylmannosamine kinase n=1 Tax=Acidovorax soli TaxID=592050 RepID=A0A1H3XQN8_9BURK|nr:ROK family protein [Acidovorax soli]SEA01775.1 N-acylmannosamine kinase [Acidovorax soli]